MTTKLFFVLTSALLAVTSVAAGEWLPKKKLFRPFVADITQPSFNTRLTGIVGGARLAEINMGDEFGLYKTEIAQDSLLQAGIMGGVGARFDISKVTNDFQIADFSLAFPIDVNRGNWGFRAMYWHTSSHVGDDYIISHAIQPTALKKHVTDEIRWYADYNMQNWLRLYGGTSYAFNLIPSTTKRQRVHTGFEAKKEKDRKSVFLAADLQSLQRLGWQPSFTARTGAKYSGENQAISCFAEFFSGHLTYLGFMDQTETHWSFGFIFEM